MQPIQHLITRSLDPLRRWLLPIGALCAFLGYVRPWIAHKAAGLAVLGLDLGELVKFLHPVQQGEIRLWREGFYLPLVAVSVSLSLNAFCRDSNASDRQDANIDGTEAGEPRPRYGWPVRIALLLLAIVTALNLLPPAWTPRLLLTPEFRLQSMAMALCLALVALSPLVGLLQSPRSLFESFGGTADGAGRRGCLWRAAWSIALVRSLFLVVSAGAAIYFPVAQFRLVIPTLAELYGQPPEIGWGPALMVAGLAVLLLHGLGDLSSQIRE